MPAAGGNECDSIGDMRSFVARLGMDLDEYYAMEEQNFAVTQGDSTNDHIIQNIKRIENGIQSLETVQVDDTRQITSLISTHV